MLPNPVNLVSIEELSCHDDVMACDFLFLPYGLTRVGLRH